MNFQPYFALLLTFAVLTEGFPEERLSKQEEVALDARNYKGFSHLLKAEHKGGFDDDRLREVMSKVLSSKTATAMDDVVSSVVTLAGGVVEDLGDLVVETIDQLPDTIKVVSDMVGKAVDQNREKVFILVKGVKLDDEVKIAKETTDRLATVVENSKFTSSLGKLEDVFASLIGKFIGVTYKNADSINSAITNGIKRLTVGADDVRKEKVDDDITQEKGELPTLSRSLKDDEPTLSHSLKNDEPTKINISTDNEISKKKVE